MYGYVLLKASSVMAVSGLVLGLAPAAVAATTLTSITGFTASTNSVSYAARSVTFSGRLVEQNTDAPVTAATIDLVLYSGVRTIDLGSATTGADGTFSATVDLPAGGYVRAAF